MAHQGTGVDVRLYGNLELLEIFFRNLLRPPVRTHFRKLADNQPLDVGTCRLIIFSVGAVVSDFRVGENYNLAAVRRVSEDFLVARDGSIENDFAVAFAFSAVAFAAEDSAVFQRKDRLH